MNYLDRYISFIEKYHRAALVAIAVATLFFAYLLSGIRFANAFEGWVQKDHAAIVQYRRFLQNFKSFEIVALVMETENGVFQPDSLRRFANVDNKIRERAEKVRSANFFYTSVLHRTPGGIEYRSPSLLVPGIHKAGGEITREQADEFRRVISRNRLVMENFVSADGRSAMDALVFVAGGPDYSFIPSTLDRIRRIMAEETAPGVKFRLAGGLVLNREMNRLTKQQALEFAPVVFGLVTLLLVLLMRNIRDVILVQLCTACSMVWALGLYVGKGYSVNFLMVAMPPLVLVISVADAVHILMRYREELGGGREPRDAVAEAVKGAFYPCLFTSLTTAAGFGVLASSSIPVIRTFGVYAAAGIMMSFALSIALIPAALMAFARAGRGGSATRAQAAGGMFSGILRFAGESAIRRPRIILLLGFAAFAASFHGMSQIKTDTNNLEFFRKDNPVRKDMEFVEKNLVGLSSMEFMFQSVKDRGMLDPGALRAVYELEKFLRRQPEVTSALSVADYVVEMNRWLTGREDEFPESEFMVRAMMQDSRFGAVAERQQFITDKGRLARVSSRVKYSSTSELRDLVARVDAYLRENASEDYGVMLTGGAPVYLAVADGVLEGQVRSFLLALVIVSIMVMLLFSSLTWGILAMIPSVIPIMFVLGIMGWAGIPLNLATMMIASISIGIAVDDTMHYMARVRRELAAGRTHIEAVRRTLQTTGHPIITTTLVLICGFGVLAFSSFIPISQFAILSTLTMVFALLGDLFLFSALLIVLKPKV